MGCNGFTFGSGGGRLIDATGLPRCFFIIEVIVDPMIKSDIAEDIAKNNSPPAKKRKAETATGPNNSK